jgi:hypothetical protein
VTSDRCRRALAVVIAIGTVWLSPRAVRAADWEPIEPAQLAVTQPSVDPQADVEALTWDIWVEDVLLAGAEHTEGQTHFKHRLRLKVFTERGLDTLKQVEIPFDTDTFVQDVQARTVRPDGTIVELKKEDVLERTLVKAGGRKSQVKSFAVPGLVPGAIVDYGWTEHRIKQFANYTRLDLQRDVPVQVVRHHVKPLSALQELGYTMALRWFGHPATEGVQDRKGYTVFTYTNLPAFKEEPFMPPEYMLRRWLLVYYSDSPNQSPQAYFMERARRLYEGTKPGKVGKAVAALSASAVAGATTPEAKVAQLVAACRQKVERVDLETSDLTQEARKKLKPNKDSEETLTRGYGTGYDVARLFLDMASAAGLDARIAAVTDASLHTFEPSFADDYFLVSRNVAVRNGDGWLFCDPTLSYLPAGMLRWQEEGQAALIADPQKLLLVSTPSTPPQQSLAQREATLRLSEDGTLEGSVTETFTGHLASARKEAGDAQSETERVDDLRQEVQRRLSTAELSEVVFENLDQPDKPFVRRYHVKVPSYAQRTGKRLFVPPSFFETNGAPTFPASARQHPIMFHYGWAEQDHVVVEVPTGFSFEQPTMPTPIDSAPVAAYTAKARIVDGNALDFERTFYFGGGGQLYYPATSYPVVKQFFDALHENDNHTLTLNAGASAATSAP